MANVKKGVCKNYDNCDKADSREPQEIKSGEQFICEECGKKLIETGTSGGTGGGGKNKWLPLIIIAAVVLLCGGGAAAYFLMGEDEPSLTALTLSQSSVEKLVGESDRLSVVPAPADMTVDYVWSSSNEAVAKVENGSVSLVGEGSATITVTTSQYPNISASCTYAVSKKSENEQLDDTQEEEILPLPSGDLDLGYAIYTGDVQNGKPHGNGTLEFKKSHKLISSKDYVASPGEKVVGSFRNGKINLATWYQKDGNQVVIK